MTKEIIISEKTYVPSDLINKDVLDVAGFTKQLECTSPKHMCLSNGTRELILEVLGDKKDPKFFKIFDIN